ncbi:uncharacterized protein BX664DRAFT_343509 [Halteromyces radiatus]|uniref:uncharacterized protein n=1 Tax=Halteromyces radiatus TaxID=101107 RepID=UPI002220373E|nr:uncharacterized protein BX664DRAFT_343509 [Halteromyces radiatus]KAI8077794.1 hypothetical protein BX664DRAFT_343509 [Halteromyces radiatus]
MENKAAIAQHIFIGTGVSVMAGATTGATMAVLKNAPVKAYAFSTGVNCGVFGATFFIIRESFLSYQRKQNPHYGLKDSETRDIDDLVSSALAGGTTGGLLSAAFRGPRGVLPGFFMFGAICTGGQLLYSAANRWRQDTIVRSGLMNLPSDQDIPTKKIWEYIEIPSWSPVRKLTNDEYNDLLDAKLKALEDEVRRIEREMQRNEQQEQQQQEKKVD